MLISNYNAIYRSSNNKISSKKITIEETTLSLSTTEVEKEVKLEKKSLIENYVIDQIKIISFDLTDKIEGKHLDLL